MLTPLSALASKQVAPLENMMQNCLQFLDYAASQEDAIVTYQASNMKLAIHSNASYLSEPKARSRAGSHMFMAGTREIPIKNRAVLNIFANNQNSDVIGRGGRTWHAVHQRQNSGVHATNTQGIGTSATTNTHPNQQFDCTRTTHQQDPPQGTKGHGYAIPLVTLPRSKGPVLLLLEAGDTKLS